MAALFITAGIAKIAADQMQRFSRNYEVEAKDKLSSIARLKAGHMTQWRKERFLEAAALEQNDLIGALARRFRQAPEDMGTGRRLHNLLQTYYENGIYDRICLLDRNGTVKLAVPDGRMTTPSAVLERLPLVLKSARAEIVDFYIDEIEQRPFLNLLVPIRSSLAEKAIESVLSLRLDPSFHIYPFIREWPSSSPSAETLLVRRDGNDVLFLNDLRFQENTALTLRVPINRRTISALAVEGREGIIEGIDYRGKSVFGSIVKIPDSPWILVALTDIKEIHAPIRKRLALNLGLLTLLLLLLVLSVWLVERREKIRILRERLAVARDLQAVSSRRDALLAAMPEIVMEVDLNSVYVWANRPGLDFFGEDVVGKEASRFFEGEQDTYQRVEPLFQGSEDVVYVESWQRRKDGQKRLLGWWCRGLKDAAGKTTGALSTARDITAERLVDEAQREMETRYRTLVDNSPLAVLIIRDGRIVLVNDACLRLFGATMLEQLLGKNMLELFHPDSHAMIRKRVEEMLKTGRPVPQMEEKIIRLNSVAVDVEATAAPFPDRGGTAIHVVLADITERKRAEDRTKAALAALRENEATFDQFMANSPVYMFFKDESIRALRLSANYKDMLGIPVEEALGKTMDELFPSDLAKRMIADDLRILKEGRVVTIDEEHNGRFYTTIKFPIEVEGKPRYLAGFTIDITARKQAEDKVKAACEAQATSLREKELLLREIHHRVKNNLQIISSLLNLEAGRVSPDVRELIKRSQTRIRSLSLIHEKLYRASDLNRIDLGGYIQTLVGHLFQVYVIDPEKIRLETEFEDVSLDINSAIPCGLLLNELISNALKHAFPAGRKGVLTVRMKRIPEDLVTLQVADDGIGLPEDFDIHNSKSFGFQIINLLVDQLEADFAVDGSLGTTFTLAFRELKYKPRL